MTNPTIRAAIEAAGFTPYEYDGSLYGCNRTQKAAALLEGRTHYFDPATTRFHKARVVKLAALCDGAILDAIETYAANYENTRRVYRPVFFALDGFVQDCPTLDESYKTRAAAERAFWAHVETLNPAQELAAAIARRRKELQRELEQLDAGAAMLAQVAQ